MKCEFDRQLINSYADGALTGGLAQDVEAHISGCDSCRIELEFTRDLEVALKSLPKETASKDMIIRILTYVASNAHKTIGDKIFFTFKAVWAITIHGFRVHDKQADLLFAELPELVMRWVLFV